MWYKKKIWTVRRGFTLIEIAVVISVIVLLALIGIPYFRANQENTELKSNANMLVSHLRLAAQKTVGEQETYLVKLFSSPDRYQLIKRSGGDTVIEEQWLSNTVFWQNKGGFTNDEIVYISNGAVVQSGNIIMENIANKTITIEIKPSGYVKIN